VTTRRRKPLALHWTPRAIGDLEAVGDYIALDNPAAAKRWVEGLMATAVRASRAPFAGRRVPEFARDDIREVLKRNYRIVYRITGQRVEVLTVFEAHRRLPDTALSSS